MHAFVHPLYYESFETYNPSNELIEVVLSRVGSAWRLRRQGIWMQVIPPVPRMWKQGWKIHVSATLRNATRVLEAATDVCHRNNTAFKFACDRNMLKLINSRHWNRASSGKFITIYAGAEDPLRVLLDELYSVLKDEQGPYVLSDRRYRDCKVLYYRYGEILASDAVAYDGTRESVLITPEGMTVPDLRGVSFRLPDWIQDPFPPDSQDDESGSLKDGRYLVFEALTFTSAGGVYGAIDSETGEEVIIKEARPGIDCGEDGRDVTDIRKHEWEILRKLEDTGLVPRPIDLFWDWEHLFLVEEFVAGRSVGQIAAAHHYLLRPGNDSQERADYVKRLKTLFMKLLEAMCVIHERGIILGDISPHNILVEWDEMKIRFIDLEGACDLNCEMPPIVTLRTPGFAHHRLHNKPGARRAEDYYALGRVFLSMFAPLAIPTAISETAPETLLDLLKQDGLVPGGIAEVIQSLLAIEDDNDIDRIVEACRLALSDELAPVVASGEPKETSEFDGQKVLRDCLSFIESSAMYDRTDRLFPASFDLRNALEVAHGAAGVIYALLRLKKSVPTRMVDWIGRQVDRTNGLPPGLYHGLAGLSWVFGELGIKAQAEQMLEASRLHSHVHVSPCILYGTAGFGMACLRAWKLFNRGRFLDWAVEAGKWLLTSKTETPVGYTWPSAEGRTYLGYARGASGIAMFLIYLYAATGDIEYLRGARKALDFDLSYAIATPHGSLSFPEDTESPQISFPYWANGSAGIGSVLLRYLHVCPEDRAVLGDTLTKIIADVYTRYTAWPGVFYGLAGLGNFLLDCYAFTNHVEYYDKATHVGSGLQVFRVDLESGAAFLGDEVLRISADFASGSSGIALFLNRLLDPTEGDFNFTLDSLIL